jgi:hypothetical protein
MSDELFDRSSSDEELRKKRFEDKLEVVACTPRPVDLKDFNREAVLPYGITPEHVYLAMQEFLKFIRVANVQLNREKIERLEAMLAPANFSGMVGDFMAVTIPRFSPGIVRNMYHNGHPDMLPAGRFEDNSVQYGDEGVEIKASRYLKGWQGHNPEKVWLMVFVFDSNRPTDSAKGVEPRPFSFRLAAGAMIGDEDWRFAPRKEGSRRTPTAGVLKTGHQKMITNWIYKAPDLTEREKRDLLAPPPQLLS